MGIRQSLGSLSLVVVLLSALLFAGCTCGDSNALSGTYEAKDGDGSISVEFKSDNKVRMTMQETGTPGDSKDGTYTVEGDKVTIQIPDGFPLTLTKKEGALEGAFMGQMLTFKKK